MINLDPKRLPNRAIFIALGIAAIGIGMFVLQRGHLFYENSWGGIVFAPLAIVMGALFIIGAVFKPDIFKT